MWLPQIDPTLINCPTSVQLCTHTHTRPSFWSPAPPVLPSSHSSEVSFLPEVIVAQTLMWFWSFSKNFMLADFFSKLNEFCYKMHPPAGVEKPLPDSVSFPSAKASTRLPLTVWPLALPSYKLHVSPLQSHCYCMAWSGGPFGPRSAGIWSVWIWRTREGCWSDMCAMSRWDGDHFGGACARRKNLDKKNH